MSHRHFAHDGRVRVDEVFFRFVVAWERAIEWEREFYVLDVKKCPIYIKFSGFFHQLGPATARNFFPTVSRLVWCVHSFFFIQQQSDQYLDNVAPRLDKADIMWQNCQFYFSFWCQHISQRSFYWRVSRFVLDFFFHHQRESHRRRDCMDPRKTTFCGLKSNFLVDFPFFSLALALYPGFICLIDLFDLQFHTKYYNSKVWGMTMMDVSEKRRLFPIFLIAFLLGSTPHWLQQSREWKSSAKNKIIDAKTASDFNQL